MFEVPVAGGLGHELQEAHQGVNRYWELLLAEMVCKVEKLAYSWQHVRGTIFGVFERLGLPILYSQLLQLCQDLQLLKEVRFNTMLSQYGRGHQLELILNMWSGMSLRVLIGWPWDTKKASVAIGSCLLEMKSATTLALVPILRNLGVKPLVQTT